MKINGEVLKTISVFPTMMTVPDCVVVGSNKLGHGHGEAKFYISSKEEMYSFYGGEKFNAKCFMLKADLVAYMLAIQTRQQLAIHSLSLASDASLGILKLFYK